ncbi:MAG TPA: magnesium/cobalt transporter CorA [Solirubrobacterales bacterium]|nr:magnesium/cobalt transporter CorA [Solirubrobacterales bacterium]
MIVDCAHYSGGKRQHEHPLSPQEAAKLAKGNADFVWLGLHEPDAEEMSVVEREFDLPELAVEDAAHAHQRPKLEDYEGNKYFVVLRTARYDDAKEEVEFGEIHLFIGNGYVIAVRHGEASELAAARGRLEQRPDLLEMGPASAVWAILDKVVDDYRPVVDGIETDIEEVEEEIFTQHGDSTQRIYFLKREVIEFHRAVAPLLGPLEQLERGAFPQIGPKLQSFFRDVADHARRVDETVMSQRELLTSVLEANLALLSVRQNEVVRAISAWAAIIAVPTFIASVYGMNFEYMPELDSHIGYPLALLAMGACIVVLYRFFRRIRWL